MTLYQLIEQLKAIALRQPNVRSASEGSVYEIMNANPGVDYDAFVITQGVHSSDDNFNHFNLSLFLISRLESDLETNRLQVQSSAREVLDNILTYFAYNFDGDTGETITFHTFTERFADECAGAWCEVTVDVPKSGICPEDYDGEDWVSPNLTIRNQTKTVEVTAATQTVTYDSGYTGLESVEIDAETYGKAMYDSGSTEGYESGHTEGYQEGYDSGHTEGYQEGYQEGDAAGYNEGYSEGASETLGEVASGAVGATYTSNGTYYADIDDDGNGYISAVTVSIPQGKLRVADYPGMKFSHSTWTEVPDYLDFEGVTDMSFMFSNVPLQGDLSFDMSGVTNLEEFIATSNTKSIIISNTDEVTNMRYIVCNNYSLSSITLGDTSRVSDFYFALWYCGELLGSISLNTDSARNIGGMFGYCQKIEEIHLTSLSGCTEYMGSAFAECSSLSTLTVTAWPDIDMASIGLDKSPLTHDSIVGLLNALPQSTGGYSFQIGQTNINKLTEEEIVIATDKGWTLV